MQITTVQLAVVGIALTAINILGSLLTGYWNRKQQRQIEAYKRDPSVGLVPPPSVVWKFVRSNSVLLVGLGIPVAALVSIALWPPPLTVGLVIGIGLVCANAATAVTLWAAQKLLDAIQGSVELSVALAQVQEKHAGLTTRLVEVVEQTRRDIKS